jgi:HK97 family phage major capsid protein
MDINDMRRARTQAATALQVAAAAIAALEGQATAADEADMTAAIAGFEAAQVAFDATQATVVRAEAVETAQALAATGDAVLVVGAGARTVPAVAANAEERGIEVGFAVQALTNARGNVGDACEALDAAGHSGISAALSGAVSTAGGVLLPRPQAESVIEMLRPRVTVRASGARNMPMPAGAVRHGSQSSSASASYGAENGAAIESEPTFSGVDQAFKTLRALVPIGNALLRHSTAAVAMLVRDDLLSVMATREDLGFLRDVGANGTPYGLKFWTPPANWLAAVGNGAMVVEQSLRKVVSSVEDANVMMTSGGWIMRAAAKNFLASLRNPDTGFLVFPSIDQNGMLLGFPIKTTSQIPANLGAGGDETEVYFGDFNEVMIGDAMSLTIATSTEAAYVNQAGDTVSAFQNDQTLMRAISEHDLAPRHVAALAGLNGQGWTL